MGFCRSAVEPGIMELASTASGKFLVLRNVNNSARDRRKTTTSRKVRLYRIILAADGLVVPLVERRDFRMPEFWEGGAGEYEKVLRQQYEAARQRLQARLDHSHELLERQAVINELADLRRDFLRRLKGIGRSLFGTQ